MFAIYKKAETSKNRRWRLWPIVFTVPSLLSAESGYSHVWWRTNVSSWSVDLMWDGGNGFWTEIWQAVWDLWWAKWQCDRLSSEFFAFPQSLSSFLLFILIHLSLSLRHVSSWQCRYLGIHFAVQVTWDSLGKPCIILQGISRWGFNPTYLIRSFNVPQAHLTRPPTEPRRGFGSGTSLIHGLIYAERQRKFTISGMWRSSWGELQGCW